jgi:tetratricopeptide (TPR) repeat protein
MVNLLHIIIILFVFLEFILRIIGFSHKRRYRYSEVLNSSSVKRDYTILCYGASFTLGIGAPEGRGYPEQLQGILNSKVKDKTFTIIKRAMSGRSTAQMVSTLKGELNSCRRKPDFVVLLAGAANSTNHWGLASYKRGKTPLSFFNNLLFRVRVYRLFIVLWKNMKNSFSALNIDRNEAFLEKAKVLAEIEQIKKKAEEQPHNSDNFIKIGQLYNQLGDPEKALSCYVKAIEIEPSEALAYRLLAGQLGRLKRLTEALVFAEKSLELDPDNCGSYLTMIVISSRKGCSYEQVLGWLEKAVRLDPKVCGKAAAESWLRPVFEWINHKIPQDRSDLRQRYERIKETMEPFTKVRAEENLDKDRYGIIIVLSKIKNRLVKHVRRHNRSVLFRIALNLKKVYWNNSALRRKLDMPEDKEDIIGWTKSDLVKIIEIFRSEGIKVILQNYPWRVYATTAANEVSQEYDVPIVDNNKIFEDLLQYGAPRSEYFELDGVGGHCNEKGYGVMAMNVYNKLKEEIGFTE